MEISEHRNAQRRAAAPLLGCDSIASHVELDGRCIGKGVAVESKAADAANEGGKNCLAPRDGRNCSGVRHGATDQPSSKRLAGTTTAVFLRGSATGRFGQLQAATTAERRSSLNFGIAASGLR